MRLTEIATDWVTGGLSLNTWLNVQSKGRCASTYFANNPLGISSNMDKLPIHPYFMYKDYFGVALFGIAFSFIVFFYPNLLGFEWPNFYKHFMRKYN